jgi:hypothetical protein
LLGHARWCLRLSENHARQHKEKTGKQRLFAANHTPCRPDSHLHAGILFERNEMMPQR